jgi:hypothetical protein
MLRLPSQPSPPRSSLLLPLRTPPFKCPSADQQQLQADSQAALRRAAEERDMAVQQAVQQAVQARDVELQAHYSTYVQTLQAHHAGELQAVAARHSGEGDAARGQHEAELTKLVIIFRCMLCASFPPPHRQTHDSVTKSRHWHPGYQKLKRTLRSARHSCSVPATS